MQNDKTDFSALKIVLEKRQTQRAVCRTAYRGMVPLHFWKSVAKEVCTLFSSAQYSI